MTKRAEQGYWSDPTRRRVLTGTGAFGLGAALALAPAEAWAQGPDFSGNPFRDRFQSFRQTFRVEPNREEAERIRQNIIAGREPRLDIVTLIAPDIAENGAAVPVTIRVACAMTEADYPVKVHLLAMENPFPEICKHYFTPANGVAEVTLRIRMRATAPLIALAVMADDSIGVAEKLVNVTIGACS